MKIKDIKKYVIGFILGLSLIGGLVFAADSGSIGALFEKITPSSPWTLKQEAIKDGSIEGVKLKDNTLSGSKIINGSITNDKIQGGISEDKLASGVQSKLNSSIDGKDVSVNNLIINGTLTTTASELEINGIKFVKKLEIIDDTWYETSRGFILYGINKVFSNSFTIPVPSGKYIASIRLTGSGTGYGGACAIFVPNKLALSGTSGNMYGTSNLTSTIDNTVNFQQTDITPEGSCGYICFKTYMNRIYNSNYSFSYGTSNLDGITMDPSSQYYTPLNYNINVSHNFTVDDIKNGKDLKTTDIIYLKKIVSQSYPSGNSSIHCKIGIQYGELVY